MKLFYRIFGCNCNDVEYKTLSRRKYYFSDGSCRSGVASYKTICRKCGKESEVVHL